MTRRSRGRGGQLDPEDVLSGRVRPKAAELAALIREVNPTGLGLPAAEEARRYALKSRLQSALLRRFAEELAIVEDGREEGVVSLRHRPSGADACHAVIDALDEDARSIVRRRLDLGGDPTSAPAPQAAGRADGRGSAGGGARAGGAREPGTKEEELLREGRAALEEYDYERARERFAAALAASGGAAGPAVALLELLVDCLAADREAIGLWAEIGEAARQEPEVRLLVALAAARAGERAQAVALVGELGSPRAAEIFATLARAALGAGDLEAAERDLAALRARDPAHPTAVALAAELERHRATAHRLARESEERAAEALAARLLAEAEAAEARGDRGGAIAALRRAPATSAGEAAARARARLAALVAAEQEEVVKAQVEATLSRLRAVDLAQGLAAYVALDAGVRRRVRAEIELPALGWLEEMGAQGTGARARAAVAAALDLGRAAELAVSAPAEALSRLRAHPALAGLAEAKRLEAAAEGALAAQRSAEAAQRLAEARAAAAAGEAERALALLPEASVGNLPEADRAEAAALRAAGAAAQARRLLAERAAALRARGALLEARAAVDQLRRGAGDEEERARLGAEREALSGAITAALRVQSFPPPPRERALRGLDLSRLYSPHGCVLADGRHAVFAQSAALWLFVRVVDLEAGQETARVALRTREALDLSSFEVARDRLVVLGAHAEVIELSLDGRWEVLAFRAIAPSDIGARSRDRSDPLPELGAPELTVRNVSLVEEEAGPSGSGGGRRVWVLMYSRRSAGGRSSQLLRVFDLDRGSVVHEARDLPRSAEVHPLEEVWPPRVALITPDTVALRSASGRSAGAWRAAVVDRSLALAPPSGDGAPGRLLGLTIHPDAVDDREAWARPAERAVPEAPVGWIELSLAEAERSDASASVPVAASATNEEHRPSRPLPGLSSRTRAVAAVGDPSTGHTFMLVEDEEARWLIGFSAAENGATEVLYKVPVPRFTALLRHRPSGRVTLLAAHADGIEAAPLDGAPPRLRPGDPHREPRPAVFGVFGARCYRPTGARMAAARALALRIRDEGQDALDLRIAAARHLDNPDQIFEMTTALHLLGRTSEANLIERHGLKAHPRYPGLVVSMARALANVRRWGEVVGMLEGLDLSGADDGTGQHACHLLGFALLQLGRAEEALAVLQRGAQLADGRCDLGWIIALATPPDEDGGAAPPEGWTPEQAWARELAGRTRAADACLARGDAAGAIAALDHVLVWEVEEVQSLARLAEAHLALDGGDDLFRAALVMATFAAAHCEVSSLYRRELPLPVGRWDAARLDELFGRVERWMDARLGEPVTLRPMVGAG